MRAVHQGYRSGLVSSTSIAVGYLPIGFSFGVAAVQADLPAGIAIFVSLWVYAGASQFLLVSLLTSGAGVWAAVPAVLMMNARHVLYGPSLAPALRSSATVVPTSVLSYALTDEVYATAMGRMTAVPEEQREGWLLGLQSGAFVAWVGGTVAGTVFVREVEMWSSAVRAGLDFILPALFLALLLESDLRRWWVVIGVAVGVTALSALSMQPHNALVSGILAGACVHLLSSRGRAYG